MKNRFIIFSSILLVSSVIYISFLATPLAAIIFVSFPITAALISIYTSKIYSFDSSNGRPLLLVAAGIVCWGIGEVMFSAFANILHISPFPSLADAFLLLAYPLLGAGIYQSYAMAGIRLCNIKKPLIVLLSSASMILTAIVMYFIVFQVYDPSADLWVNIVNLGYGLGDLILVILSFAAILVANEYRGGKLASFWQAMASGFLLILIADIIFAMYSDQILNNVEPYTYVDLLWMAGYQILAFGMLENYLHISAVQKKIIHKISQKSS